MAWPSMISEFIALIVASLCTKDPRQETQVRASMLLDAPKHLTRHVHYEDNILKPGRRDTSSSTREHQDKAARETATKTKPIPIKHSRRNVGDERRHRGFSPGREETTNSGLSPLRWQGAHWRHKSPEPFATPTLKKKGVANKKRYVEYVVRDTEPWDEYDNDEYNSESSDEEMATKPNPLQDCPHVDESTFLWRYEVEPHPKTCQSLLTKKLSGYATEAEVDASLPRGIQAAIRRQGAASRAAKNQLRRLEAEGQKTKIPVCMKGPPERLETEGSATF